MRFYFIAAAFALLSACGQATFVADAPPVAVTGTAPDHFELPARFALARTVYGRTEAGSAKEVLMWEGLAERSKRLGSFAPFVQIESPREYRYYDRRNRKKLVEKAREQRYDYLLTVHMHPETGSADIILQHTGSGGVMATAQAVSKKGGRRGFWGGKINRQRRLDRVTLRIAEAAEPVIEEMLRGIEKRQLPSN